MMGVFFTIPIFLQTVLGYSALRAGLVMSPMSVVIIFAAPAAGRLSDRLGSKWIVAAGMFILALGIALMAGLTPFQDKLTPATSSLDLLAPFILAGLGIGLSIAPVTSAVMATAPLDRAGNASGVLSTMRQVGSLMGIAILGAVLQNRIVANIHEGVLGDPGHPGGAQAAHPRPAMGDLDQMRMGMSAAAGEMPAQARELLAGLFKGWFTDAINTTFVVGVVICLAGGVSALFLRSHVGVAAGEAEDARRRRRQPAGKRPTWAAAARSALSLRDRGIVRHGRGTARLTPAGRRRARGRAPTRRPPAPVACPDSTPSPAALPAAPAVGISSRRDSARQERPAVGANYMARQQSQEVTMRRVGRGREEQSDRHPERSGGLLLRPPVPALRGSLRCDDPRRQTLGRAARDRAGRASRAPSRATAGARAGDWALPEMPFETQRPFSAS